MLEKLLQNMSIGKPPAPFANSNSLNLGRNKLPTAITGIRKTRSLEDQHRLVISTWETDTTTDMFDYETKSTHIKEHKLEDAHDIYIAHAEKRYTKCILTKPNLPNSNTFCGRVEKTKGFFYFTPASKMECFRVLGYESGYKTQIQVGDLIRIGRVKYFLKETYNGHKVQSKSFQRNNVSKPTNLSSLKQGTCKFCLCDENDNEDLLISPCSCKGSCAQVHLNCLKQWLSNKVSRKSTSCVDFLNYDNFSCELCKDSIPTVLKIDGKDYDIINQSGPSEHPYIVLEGISQQKQSTKNNISIKIYFKEKETLIIGRGHEADVKLEDVSISRQHCMIKFNPVCGNFYIVDNYSKFGTLVKVQPGSKVNLHDYKLQIAKMTLSIAKNQNQKEQKQN